MTSLVFLWFFPGKRGFCSTWRPKENIHDILRLANLSHINESLSALSTKPSAPHLPTVLGGPSDSMRKSTTV